VGPKSKSRQKVGRDIKKVEKHWSKRQNFFVEVNAMYTLLKK